VSRLTEVAGAEPAFAKGRLIRFWIIEVPEVTGGPADNNFASNREAGGSQRDPNGKLQAARTAHRSWPAKFTCVASDASGLLIP